MRKLTCAAATLVWGTALLAAAVPLANANLAALLGDHLVALASEGETLTPEAYDKLVRTRNEGLAWSELPRLHAEAGHGHLVRSLAAPKLGFDADAELAAARTHLRRSLAMSPVNAHAWYWLGLIELNLDDKPAAATALRFSLRANPQDPFLAAKRASLGFALWAGLDPTTRAAMRRDLVEALEMQPEDVMMAAMEYDKVEAMRELLADDPEAIARMDEQLLRF